jgi:hypothetical protein
MKPTIEQIEIYRTHLHLLATRQEIKETIDFLLGDEEYSEELEDYKNIIDTNSILGWDANGDWDSDDQGGSRFYPGSLTVTFPKGRVDFGDMIECWEIEFYENWVVEPQEFNPLAFDLEVVV